MQTIKSASAPVRFPQHSLAHLSTGLFYKSRLRFSRTGHRGQTGRYSCSWRVAVQVFRGRALRATWPGQGRGRRCHVGCHRDGPVNDMSVAVSVAVSVTSCVVRCQAAVLKKARLGGILTHSLPSRVAAHSPPSAHTAASPHHSPLSHAQPAAQRAVLQSTAHRLVLQHHVCDYIYLGGFEPNPPIIN